MTGKWLVANSKSNAVPRAMIKRVIYKMVQKTKPQRGRPRAYDRQMALTRAMALGQQRGEVRDDANPAELAQVAGARTAKISLGP